MSALRVLIMEDEPVIAMLLAEVLESMGHEVCAIEATQAEAVAAALLHKPGFLIADAWLREGSGILAVEQISCSGYVPHIFISADRLNQLELSPGAVVLQKPFSRSALIRAIEGVLGAETREKSRS